MPLPVIQPVLLMPRASRSVHLAPSVALLASRLSQTAYTIPIVECIGDDGEDEEERLRRREALRRGVPVESIR